MYAEIASDTHKKLIAIIFVFSGIPLLLIMFCNVGPSMRLFNSHECIRSDPRAKQASASNKNGVVGNNGKNTPIRPSTTAIKPTVLSSMRISIICVVNNF